MGKYMENSAVAFAPDSLQTPVDVPCVLVSTGVDVERPCCAARRRRFARTSSVRRDIAVVRERRSIVVRF